MKQFVCWIGSFHIIILLLFQLHMENYLGRNGYPISDQSSKDMKSSIAGHAHLLRYQL